MNRDSKSYTVSLDRITVNEEKIYSPQIFDSRDDYLRHKRTTGNAKSVTSLRVYHNVTQNHFAALIRISTELKNNDINESEIEEKLNQYLTQPEEPKK
ncbi:hypothetical protein CL622_02230 [archaeon]|nr:hypothetical protein [archaeon]|tara:strand:- start:1898 stop:2191 length:294 start_codon:yes stop_codon:yes gene_type:complete